MFGRVIVFIYGLICYVLFLVTFLYAIGFVTDLYVPHTLDSARRGPLGQSLLIDLLLLSLFAVQHSGHGACALQALADSADSGSGGAQHLRARRFGRAAGAVLCLAPPGRPRLGRGRRRRERRAAVPRGVRAGSWCWSRRS